MQQILCHSQGASCTHFSHSIQTKKKHITGLRPGVLVGQNREEEEDNEDKEGKDEGEDEDEDEENECLQFEVSVLS